MLLSVNIFCMLKSRGEAQSTLDKQVALHIQTGPEVKYRIDTPRIIYGCFLQSSSFLGIWISDFQNS